MPHPKSSGPPSKPPPQNVQARGQQPVEVPYVFRRRVLRVDIPRLTREFPDPSRFAEAQQCLARAVESIASHPEWGKELQGKLSGWLSYAWPSASEPDWDPWPDMRLVYRVEQGRLVILAIGRRKPGEPDDVYRWAEWALNARLEEEEYEVPGA